MKVNKIVWKTPDGQTALVDWEIGSQRAKVSAYEVDRQQLKQLIKAAQECEATMAEAEQVLEQQHYAQRAD
jgi:hypothetical protein